eukprot:1150940-Pleurochrysis_carterae.AAC.1
MVASFNVPNHCLVASVRPTGWCPSLRELGRQRDYWGSPRPLSFRVGKKCTARATLVCSVAVRAYPPLTPSGEWSVSRTPT